MMQVSNATQYTYVYDDAANRTELNSPLLCDVTTCECPPSTEGWLVLETETNSVCSDGQCYVTHTLNIPEGNDCFTHYQVDDGNSLTDVKLFPRNNKLKDINRCIDDNESLNVTVYLMRSPTDPNPCVMTASISCSIDCCDFLSIEFNRLDPNSCCWVPTIVSSSNYCGSSLPSINDVIYYVDGYMVGLDLNDAICLDMDQNQIEYKINNPGLGLDCETVKSAILECECTCPEDDVLKDWLTVTTEKEGGSCGATQCAVTATLEVPTEYASCYSKYEIDYKIRAKDGSLVSETMHSGSRLDIPVGSGSLGSFPCIEAGETVQVKVRLYVNGTSSKYCEILSSPEYCNKTSMLERPAPCTPDNPSDLWKEGHPFQININGCKYMVLYSYRMTTDGYQDVQITGMQQLDGICNSITDEELFKKAVTKAINNIIYSDKNFKPQEGDDEDCINIWRLVHKSCWTTYICENYDPVTEAYLPYLEKVPCESECCARQLRVCNKKGIISVEDLGFSAGSSYYNCSEKSIVLPENVPINVQAGFTPIGCEDKSCDIFEDMVDYDTHDPYRDVAVWEGPVGKIQIKNEKNDNMSNSKGMIMVYKVVTNNNDFKLIVAKTILENITLNLYDINGLLLLSKDYNLKGNYEEFYIDISKFNSGTFVFNLVSDRRQIGTGKFQLVK